MFSWISVSFRKRLRNYIVEVLYITYFHQQLKAPYDLPALHDKVV